MRRYGFQAVLLFLFFVSLELSGMGQASPCTAGTMANVQGTSCSIGNITFNFQNDFDFSVSSVQNGVFDFHAISPATVGFIPIQNGNQAGFQIVLNVMEGPGDAFFLSTHTFNFSYLPRANPGSVIRGESLTLDGAIQNPGTGTEQTRVLAADNQCYSNGIFEPLFPQLFSQPGIAINDPAESILLEVPSVQAVGCFAGVPTTTIQSLATGAGSARLSSVTFLYTMDAHAALPALANLRYSNIDLPGVASTLASNINNQGQIVGSVQDASGVFHGFVTDARGQATTFDFPGATATFAQGLNDRGDVVGAYMDDAGGVHGFILEDGSFSTLDFPGAIFNSPVQINNRREVAGLFQQGAPNFGVLGYVFSGGAFTVLDHNPSKFGSFTEAFGINNREEVVGAFLDPFTTRAFKLENNIFTDFDVPGQGDTLPFGLNDRGDMVGIASDSDFIQHGFVLAGGDFRTVEFPDGESTTPEGINASGRIVGVYTDADGVFHSFLAEPQAGNSQSAPSRGTRRNHETQLPGCGSSEWQKHPENVRRSIPCKPGQ
jgi:uncharacterized membrane protein